MEVFKRHEKKYLITRQQKKKFLEICGEGLRHNKYFKSTVGNVYFDTKNNDLIIKSIEKPEFKEKVRIRSYGKPGDDDYIFFEIKVKRKVAGRKNGYKRRFELLLRDYKEYMSGKASLEEIARRKIEKPNDVQVAREIEYLCTHLKLEPKIYIACDRESYEGTDDENLRITFDENLKYRLDDLNLDGKKRCKRYFGKSPEEKNIIMEIKAINGLPLPMVKALNECKIYPQPFSKYGKIYEKIMKGERNV